MNVRFRLKGQHDDKKRKHVGYLLLICHANAADPIMVFLTSPVSDSRSARPRIVQLSPGLRLRDDGQTKEIRMRAYLLLMFLPTLGGCAYGGSLGPGKVPDDATGALYTIKPAAAVAACIASAIGGTMQTDADRQVVTSPPGHSTTYNVGANATDSVYPTQVIIRGDYSNDGERSKAALCL